MRTFKTVKALLLSTLVSTAILGSSASATPVYFSNDSGASGVVDVYIDGQLVFDDIFADSSMMFPRDVAAGQHQVVVTPFYLAPGQQDVLVSTVDVPASGEYTLALTPTTDTYNVPTLTLDLSSGHTD